MLRGHVLNFFCIAHVILVESLDALYNDTFLFWNYFRDPYNGLYCDSLFLTNNTTVCGSKNNVYSIAAQGMGLLADCVFTELGFLDRDVAKQRAQQTLESIILHWPREKFSGFWVHFTNANFESLSEFSTVDSAELAAGALFAGNYYKGHVKATAYSLVKKTSWAASISQEGPVIHPTVDPATGVFGGIIRPYNEYYILAYLAKFLEQDNERAKAYFDTYFSSSGPPPGLNGYPVKKKYYEYELLTDNNETFMSSFIPQFCWFFCKGFHTNSYYRDLMTTWLHADQDFWRRSLNASSSIWGFPVQGRVWGCGAGDSPTGYGVERINGSQDLVFSAAIMAGFLPIANADARETIKGQLTWLYENNVCAYEVTLPSGSPRVLWRCSVCKPQWRASVLDSIDFGTLVLGYASLFLPVDFYANYAI